MQTLLYFQPRLSHTPLAFLSLPSSCQFLFDIFLLHRLILYRVVMASGTPLPLNPALLSVSFTLPLLSSVLLPLFHLPLSLHLLYLPFPSSCTPTSYPKTISPSSSPFQSQSVLFPLCASVTSFNHPLFLLFIFPTALLIQFIPNLHHSAIVVSSSSSSSFTSHLLYF